MDGPQVLGVAAIVLLVTTLPALLLVSFGRRCPHCLDLSLPLRSLLLRPVRRLMVRRWCLRCGWTGLFWVGRGLPQPDATSQRSDVSWRAGGSVPLASGEVW